ncbi:HTTM domain-containing protein [Streptomyces polyrhachis]|uniref:HTTM domain-containing protein n=1 Tax=Streptomyces polyrhachis TaxID=1282885 RepID=A0ABW2GES1_9ACTN
MSKVDELADEDQRLLWPLVDKISHSSFALRQLAAVRILMGVALFGLLVRNFPYRHELYGPDGYYSFELWKAMQGTSGVFGWSSSELWFEFLYALAIVVSVALIIGWRTRLVSAVFCLIVVGLHARLFVGLSGGDMILRITSLLLPFTNCGAAWSLDARRRRRKGDEPDLTGRILLAVSGLALVAMSFQGYYSWKYFLALWLLWAAHPLAYVLRGSASWSAVFNRISNLASNSVLVLIGAQLCVVYLAASWYKIQHPEWQDGTGVYWSMLGDDHYNSWPELSEFLARSPIVILILTWGTVLLQCAFPFALFSRKVKNVLLILLLGEHIGIGVMMALPFFSIQVIAADMVFVSTAWMLYVERYAGIGYAAVAARAPSRLRKRKAGVPKSGKPAKAAGDGAGDAASNPEAVPAEVAN